MLYIFENTIAEGHSGVSGRLIGGSLRPDAGCNQRNHWSHLIFLALCREKINENCTCGAIERDEENSKTIGHISSSLTCAKKIDENYSQEAREKGEKTRLTYNCAHLRSTKESLTVEFGKKMCKKLFFHKVSDVFIVTIGRYWLIHDVSGSVWDSAGWYMMILGQYEAELVDTW